MGVFTKEEPFKIAALAGSGKTSTLEYLARSTSRRGLYLAFNRDIVNAAKGRFPAGCDAATTHAIAMRGLPQDMRNAGNEKLTTTASVPMVAKVLGLPEKLALQPKGKGEAVAFDSHALAGMVRRAVASYAHSADEGLGPKHVQGALAQYSRLAAVADGPRAQLAKQVTAWSGVLWEKMRSPRDPMPLGFDGYLKVWALGQPRLGADYILYDEAQDANPVMAEVLRRHADEGLAQVVCVGDPYQQIYAWRGAVNALETLPGRVGAELTVSFRFDMSIATVANRLLAKLGSRSSLRGAGKVEGHVYHAAEGIGLAGVDAVLCRTNYGVMAALLEATLQGLATCIPKQAAQELKRQLEDVQRLQQGIPAQTPELAGFTHWKEVEEIAKEPHGAEFTTLVGLVSRYGAAGLMGLVAQAQQGDEARGILVTTAHKAKGGEWDHVLLWQDFQPPERKVKDREGEVRQVVDEEAARLLYVAVTRAKSRLGIPAWLG